MKQNLDSLKKEILEYLEGQGVAVFYGFVADLHEQRLVLWDVEQTPDFRAFVTCAMRAGIKLIIVNSRAFRREMVDDALAQLEDCDLPRDEQRAIERRLKELRPFEGFTCSVELAFEQQGRFYIYDMRTEWYEELLDIMDRLESAIPEMEGEDDEEDPSMGGYFSRN